jgi:hypothetical protein
MDVGDPKTVSGVAAGQPKRIVISVSRELCESCLGLMLLMNTKASVYGFASGLKTRG